MTNYAPLCNPPVWVREWAWNIPDACSCSEFDLHKEAITQWRSMWRDAGLKVPFKRCAYCRGPNKFVLPNGMTGCGPHHIEYCVRLKNKAFYLSQLEKKAELERSAQLSQEQYEIEQFILKQEDWNEIMKTAYVDDWSESD